jgi:hypothetical protein
MKHRYLSLLLLFSAFQASAQNKAIAFGVRGGLQMSSLSRATQPDIRLQEPDGYAPGYFAGVFTNVNIGRFTIQPSVNFNAIAAKSTEEKLTGDIVDNVYGKWNLNYLHVPVNLIYNFKGYNSKFYAGVGAYFAAALSGKFTPDGDNVEELYRQQYVDYYSFKAKFGNGNNSDFKSLDYGFNLVAGVYLNQHLSLNLLYTYGIANIQGNKNYFLYKSAHINSTGVSLGYQF